MKFLCLGYYDAKSMDARPKAEIDAIMSQCRPFIEELHDTGQVVMDAGLDLETRRLKLVRGKVEIVEGRVLEACSRIGGVFVIEARDMEDAIRVAAMHPTTRVSDGEQFGWAIEIRPIHTFWPADAA
ncbi:YciI family protein [Sphingorhabdus sp.]|uniref:YciI family protein n=1 Tax=Sphingorhabdus sp. TaxID=1902408 RepID=UPI0032B7932F